VFGFAVDGRAWAVQFIADRTEGKAIERSVVSDEWKEVVKEAYKPES
jgi:hypothetical protein